MVAFTNQAGAARYLGSRHLGDSVETLRYGQTTFLDELPGLAFAIVTLVWIVGSFARLVL